MKEFIKGYFAVQWYEFVASIAWRVAAWQALIAPDGANRRMRQAKEAEGDAKMPAMLASYMEADLPPEEEPLPPPPNLLLQRQPYCRIPSLAPAIGMHSTARDMGRLMSTLLKGRDPPGRLQGASVLRPRTVLHGMARAWSPHPSLPGRTLLGFAEMYHGSRRYLVCDGADAASGSCATMILMPEEGVGVFLAFNCCGHGAPQVRPTFAERFMDYYYPVDKEPLKEEKEEEESVVSSEEYPDVEDGVELTASITHGTVSQGSKTQTSVTGIYAQGLTGVDEARQSTVLDPAALRKQAAETLEREAKEKELAEAKALAEKEAAEERRLEAMAESGMTEKEIEKRRKQRDKDKKKGHSDATLKTSWFDNHFKDYADAMREGDTEAVDRLVAQSDLKARKTSGYDPAKYVGTFVSTAASLQTVDALRCFQSQLKVGIDREGRLYLRRCGVAGGPDCGAGPAQRGLTEAAFSDASLVCVDATKHVFRREDRPLGPNGEAAAEVGKPAGLIAFGTDFEENVTHIFLEPSSLAFRKLQWWESLGVTYAFTLFAAASYFLGLFTWWFVVPVGPEGGSPRLPWTIDWYDPSKNESIPKECVPSAFTSMQLLA